MNHIKLVSALCMLLLFSVGSATAEGIGYWNKSGGQIWKSGFGECWRSSDWSEAASSPECGGMAAPEAPMFTGYYWPDDQDYDGVIDADDECPFTPEGIKVESNGCAEDYDGDGVPDYLDKCPETPLGDVVDLVGCSIKIVSLEGVHFAFNSATLTNTAKSILDSVVGKINAHPSTHFTVVGHTDNKGSDVYNQDLSERRAKSVKNYLVTKGVSTSSFSVIGKGENSPVTSNDTSEGRAKNRRVDVLAR
ncbi:MAG: OmpA family protein [Gammaproteobacteria bacterium]